MSIKNPRVITGTTVGIIAAALIYWAVFLAPSPHQRKVNGAQPQQPKVLTKPEDDVLYVYPPPDRGFQTVVIMKVVDGSTIEAAYLVPIRFKLHGATVPSLKEKGGKEAKEALDKLLTGQLRTANLHGISSEGILADFWISKGKGKGEWVTKLLSQQGHAKLTISGPPKASK